MVFQSGGWLWHFKGVAGVEGVSYLGGGYLESILMVTEVLSSVIQGAKRIVMVDSYTRLSEYIDMTELRLPAETMAYEHGSKVRVLHPSLSKPFCNFLKPIFSFLRLILYI